MPFGGPPGTDPARSRWLLAPIPDLLLGCGGVYAVAFVVLSVAGAQVRAALPFSVVPLLYLVTSAPHYGATLLRVYERPEDRSSYAIFAVWISAALAISFVAGLRSISIGSWILTIYLTWSPWHYSGQNYGIATMFLRRRGVEVTPLAKRALHASFVLSFALTFLALHGQAPAATYAPQGLSGMVYQLRPIGIPMSVVGVAMNVTAVLYALSLAVAGVQLAPRSSFRDLAPSLALVASQALWFSAPALARQWHVLTSLDPFSVDHALYTFVYIAIAHAVQYLWITWYFARTSGRASSGAVFYGRSLLAGIALWTVPALVFAPGLLGRLPFDAGLSMLVGAVVNLHHFVLDGAIWKLRDGRIARVLIRPAQEAAVPPVFSAEAGAAPRRWIWPLVSVAGALSVAVTLLSVFEDEIGFHRSLERGDLARAESAAGHLARIGRDSSAYHLELALYEMRNGRRGDALARVDRSLALHPTTSAWLLKGQLFEAEDRWRDAIAAYRSAVALDPSSAFAHYREGLAWLRVGEILEARRALSTAAMLAPDRPEIEQLLRQTLRARPVDADRRPPAPPLPPAGRPGG